MNASCAFTRCDKSRAHSYITRLATCIKLCDVDRGVLVLGRARKEERAGRHHGSRGAGWSSLRELPDRCIGPSARVPANLCHSQDERPHKSVRLHPIPFVPSIPPAASSLTRHVIEWVSGLDSLHGWRLCQPLASLQSTEIPRCNTPNCRLGVHAKGEGADCVALGGATSSGNARERGRSKDEVSIGPYN